jgi:hypothetical protein
MCFFFPYFLSVFRHTDRHTHTRINAHTTPATTTTMASLTVFWLYAGVKGTHNGRSHHLNFSFGSVTELVIKSAVLFWDGGLWQWATALRQLGRWPQVWATIWHFTGSVMLAWDVGRLHTLSAFFFLTYSTYNRFTAV